MKHITLIDLGQDKSTLNPYLSTTLLQSIAQNISQNKKILLYLNKRGSHNLALCRDCQYIYYCPRCDVSLSVHQDIGSLLCHHCSYQSPLPIKCQNCQSTHIDFVGIGTQAIQNALLQAFSQAKIFRMDRDSVASKSQKERAIQDMHQADIIIGTKMITTGFDFHDIGLIAVILLEQELQSPSYDSMEGVYQNITQLLGRGGRLGTITQNIIQTFTPNNPTIQTLISSNYKDFFLTTLKERKLFGYPPFGELYILQYRHPNKQKSIEYTTSLTQTLNDLPHKDIEIIPVLLPFKKNNQYFTKILLKGKDIATFLQHIKKEIYQKRNLSVIRH